MKSEIILLLSLALLCLVSAFPLPSSVYSVSCRKLLTGHPSRVTPCFSTSEIGNARGLLRGIFDVSNAKDYSRGINVDYAVDLLRDTKHLYNIALEDTLGNATECRNNLTEIVKKANTFMINQDEVWDRDELKRAILNIFSGVGNFVCLLGGKSTGKSLVIRDLEKLNMSSVFVVDLRVKGSNILNALLAVLQERKKYYLDMKEKQNVKTVITFARALATSIQKGEEFNRAASMIQAILDNVDATQSLEALINELVKSAKCGITLVIDESNIAFTITPDTEKSEIKAMKEALALITSLTKQNLKLNVIFASSEHAFPSRLGDPRLGFNTVDLTGFIFAGEVPPNKMYELLTTRWNVGHNLAVTLIDHYGGHIYDILLQLKELNAKGENYCPGSQAQTNSVQMCLDFDGDKKRMRELLTQIAEKGFAPIRKVKDREAEVISKYNVGGLVQKDMATVIGLPDDVWGKRKIGLIPSKQSIRLVIAEVLHDFPEVLEDNARVVSTGVVSDLKSLSPTDEQLIELTKEIEEIKAEIKASIDPEEKNQLRKEKEQLRKEKEQLREKELILLRRQDGSDK